MFFFLPLLVPDKMKNSLVPIKVNTRVNPKKARGFKRIEPITATRNNAPVIVRI